jgi:hypothetical protein
VGPKSLKKVANVLHPNLTKHQRFLFFYFCFENSKEGQKRDMASECRLTFGARRPHQDHFFHANGTKGSATYRDSLVGTTFVSGTPMILTGVSWNKPRYRDLRDSGNVAVVRNGTRVLPIFITDLSGNRSINPPLLFDTRASIQLIATAGHSEIAFQECLITLYFQAFSIELQRQITNVSLNMIPFGGQMVSTNLSFLTFDGNTESVVTTNGSDPRTKFVVPASMTVLSVSFVKSFFGDNTKATYMKMFKNGVELEQARFAMRGLLGVVDFGWLDDLNPAKHLEKGDVIQLQYWAGNGVPADTIAPSSCLLTLNTIRREMASGYPEFTPAGSITFAGFIDGRRQSLQAGGQANVRAGVIGTTAVVVIPSRVARVTWLFERNTRHWFQLMKNGEFFADLELPTPSGVLVIGPSYRVNPGDTLQLYCFHEYWENRFPGPITVTLHMEEVM